MKPRKLPIINLINLAIIIIATCLSVIYTTAQPQNKLLSKVRPNKITTTPTDSVAAHINRPNK
jgi:hypothetical protein